MIFSPLAYAIWIVTAAALACLAVVVIKKKVFHQFPAFALYVGYELIVRQGVMAGALAGSYQTYYWTYWITKFIAYVLQVAVVCEIIRQVFAPYRGAVRSPRIITMLIAGTVPAVVSLWLPVAIADRWIAATAVADRTCAIFECSMFIVLAAMARMLGLGWKDRVLSIAAGFGIFAGMDLLVTVLHGQFGWLGYGALKNIRVFSYLTGVLFWTVALARQKTPASLHLSSRWLQRLSQAAQPMARFISHTERTPEQCH